MASSEYGVVLSRKNHFFAGRLIQEALSGFYAFESDLVEDEIERLWKKYRIYNFNYPEGIRSRIRAELMSKPKIREAVIKVAKAMYHEPRN